MYLKKMNKSIHTYIHYYPFRAGTALPAVPLRPGTARYAAWQRRSTDLGAAPGERLEVPPGISVERGLTGDWTSKHGGLTSRNGGLTSKSCNLTMKNRDSTIKDWNLNLTIQKLWFVWNCHPITSNKLDELNWFMEMVGLRNKNGVIMEILWV